MSSYTSTGNLTLNGNSAYKVLLGNGFSGIPEGQKFYKTAVLVFGYVLPTSDLTYNSSGNLLLGGESATKHSINLRYSSSGNLTLSGESLVKINKNYTSTGNLIVSGISSISPSKYNFIYDNTSGNLALSGNSICSIRRMNYSYPASGYLILGYN